MSIRFQHKYRALVGSLLTTAAALCSFSAMAQSFPHKPMRIIVGAPPGGSADTIARSIGEGLSHALGQPVVVENKPGSSGLIGTQELLRSPRDGHTLMITVNGMVSEVPHMVKLPIDPMKELRPLAKLARAGLLMVASPQIAVSDLQGAIAYMKARPGVISYASYSTGSVSHTLGLEFNKLMGTDMVHVGYRGSPPALADVMGGRVPFMFDGPATSIPLIKSGKLQVIATTSPHRLSVLPAVPTFAELGYEDLTELVWMGLWTTPDVPFSHQARIRETVLKVVQGKRFRDLLAGLGMDAGSEATPEELMRLLRSASDKQAATLRALGFKPE